MKPSLKTVAFVALLTLGLSPLSGAQSRTSRRVASNQASRGAYIRRSATARLLPYRDLIIKCATEYHVHPALIGAVILVESGGNPMSISSSGAMGLMQLMPSTCTDLGVMDAYDPEENIRGGAALLSRHIQKYSGNLKKVLAAYNAGPKRVDDGSWTKIAQTKRYVPAVLDRFENLKPAFSGLNPELWEQPIITAPPVDNSYTPPSRDEHLLDGAYEIVRKLLSASASSPIAENGSLDNAADVVLLDIMSGKSKPEDAQTLADKYVAMTPFHARSVTGYCVSTKTVEQFASVWAKQKLSSGRFVGLAHDSNKQGHVWVVILADQ